MRTTIAVSMALASLSFAAQEAGAQRSSSQVPAGKSLVECELGRINFETRDVEGPTQRFAVLLGEPLGRRHSISGPGEVRVFDPANLLSGFTLENATYSEDPVMLQAQTSSDRPAYFRFAVSLEQSTGVLGLNGAGSAEEHMAQSYMGSCTVSEPADAVAQFEALGAAQ